MAGVVATQIGRGLSVDELTLGQQRNALGHRVNGGPGEHPVGEIALRKRLDEAAGLRAARKEEQ